MKVALTRVLVVAVLGLLTGAPAEARTCFLWQVTGVAFGSYLPMQPTPLDARGRVQVLCWGRAQPGQGNSYTIRISGVVDPGIYGRRMMSGTNELEYNLFKDTARTDVWGDGTFGKTPVVHVLNGNRFIVIGNHWVYGRIPPSVDPASGVYNDIVDVTIEF